MNPKLTLVRQVGLATEIRSILEDPRTRVAIETAWGQFCLDLQAGPNPAATDCMRQGAAQFISTFESIATPNASTPKTTVPKLT